MIFVPRSKLLPRSLWRPALLFFSLAQVMLALAPLAEARTAGLARAHVEEAGTSLHHAHNEADCVACAAREILSSSDPSSREGYDSDAASGAASLARSVADPSETRTAIRSRAPPVLFA